MTKKEHTRDFVCKTNGPKQLYSFLVMSNKLKKVQNLIFVEIKA
jgi:hypothetical protein